jgi:hypothetical protein
MADVEFAESAKLPPLVIQVEHARLVDAQPHVRHQPSDRVVACSRSELATPGQLLTPAGEQLVKLGFGWRNSHLRVDRHPWTVHLIDRTLDHSPSQLVQFDFVAELEELEVGHKHLRPGRPNQSRISCR